MNLNMKKRDLIIGFIMFSTIFFIKYILVKPVYVILSIFIILGFLNKKYNVSDSYILISYVFISYLIYHLIFLESDPGMVLNAILSILIFPIFYHVLNKISINSIRIFLNLSILYLFIEMTYRVLNPVYELYGVQLVSESGSGWFYPYKINSFVFTDSNYVALHIFCLLFICLLYRLKTHYFLLLVLMFLTFSRSGLLGAVLVTLYYTVRDSRFSKVLKPLFYNLVFLVFFYIIYNLSFVTDGSFLSKFQIYNDSIDYALNHFELKDYFFGVGLSKSFDLINIGAHSIWVIILFETGLLGLIIYAVYFSVFFNKYYNKSRANRDSLFFFLMVFLLMGFSLGLYLFPIMVLTIAFILRGRENVIK